MNYISRHQGVLKISQDIIKELEGSIVECKSSTEGKVIWKVIQKVIEDELKEVREKEEDLSSNNKFSIDKIKIEDEEWDYNNLIYHLWGVSVNVDVLMTNDNIISKNKKSKEKYQRTIWVVLKSRYVCFKAFLMVVSVQKDQGKQL